MLGQVIHSGINIYLICFAELKKSSIFATHLNDARS